MNESIGGGVEPGPDPFPASPAGSSDAGAIPPTARPKGKRTRFVVAGLVIVVLLGTAVAATLVAIHDTRTGNEWKGRATNAETQLSDLRAAYDDAVRRIDEAADKIDALEERTVTLADEKARAGDRFAIADIDGATAAGVADQLEACTADLIAAFSAISSASSQSEIDRLAADFQTTAALCESAAGGARGLSDFLAPDRNP